MNRSAERALAIELKQTTQHIHSSADPMLVDSGEVIVEVNQAFLGLHGYDCAAELEGKHLASVIGEGDRERLLSIRRRWLRGQTVPSIFEFQGLRQDGMLVDLEAFVTLLQAGSQPRFVTLIRDMGLRKLTERALRDSEARLRTVVESLGEGLLITDLDDVVQIVNARMLGFTDDEIKGRRAFELLLPREEWGAVPNRYELRSKGITERFETLLLRKDGSSFWAEVNASPLCDPNGAVIGTLSVTNDITARKLDEERLNFQADVLSQVTEAIHPAAVERNQMELPVGTETVLLVEDESVVRSLVHQVLKRSGYNVLESQHGAEALRIVLQHPDVIHLLLTDLVMPLMGGRDLARRLVGMGKDIKVLYMSGYTDDSAIRQGALEPGTDFIQKPFTPDALLRKVRDVLDS